MKQFIKDPQANLDYQVDWATYLGSDTISTSTFSATPGITVGIASNTTTTATIWLSGGIVGQAYNIVNQVVTAGGRTDERSFQIVVMDR